MTMHLKRLIASVIVCSFIVLGGCSSKKLETMVLTMCKYIPDGGLRDDAEFHLTDSYYRAFSEAREAPISPTSIGDEEFLNYFVTGQDGEPIFSVKSIKKSGDSVIAKVYIQQGYDGIPWEDSEKVVHTLRLIRDMDSVSERYLLDDFDNTKQECLDYVKKVREEYKSGEFERRIRSDGGSSRDINNFRRELRAFYAKYGDDDTIDTSDSNHQSNYSSNASNQPVTFSSAKDVEDYILGAKFRNQEGDIISFSEQKELVLKPRNASWEQAITEPVEVQSFSEATAVLHGKVGNKFLRIEINAAEGTLKQNADKNTVYYNTKNSSQNTSSQSSSNPSRGTVQQTVSFSSPMDVTSYLRSRKFSNSEGYTMSFSSSLEMSIDNTPITGAMRIVDYNSTQAVISGVSPYDGGTVRLRIDATNGVITNIDEPSEVFRLKTSGGMRF